MALKMLINFSVQNFASFNHAQDLNMVASTSTKEQTNLNNTETVDAFGIKSVLKSAAIFGANGSGKTNLIEALSVLQRIVLGSLGSVEKPETLSAIPFFLKENYFDIPTEFEVTFIAEGNLYRYGLEISDGDIVEEWLYWIKSSRETNLFHRYRQTVSYNQRSFSEAKFFTKEDGETFLIEKTKPTIPFVSVLSQFDGERSTVVTEWFKKLNIISGIEDKGFRNFTVKLFEEDPDFKGWALEILKAVQIHDISVVESETEFPLVKTKEASLKDKELQDVFSKLEGIFENRKFKKKEIDVIKRGGEGDDFYSLPISFESDGTQKLIYLLGPLYDVIKNNEILVVDEFDSKFHTLLCKFIIGIFNDHSHGGSQLIVTCHDTNLLTNELFRRDQVWFVDKNGRHESELYSLIEYKEHYTRKENSYSRDYLLGKYGAIPLFSSAEGLGEMFNA